MTEKITDILGIGNYYGGLSVKQHNGQFFWGIEDYHGTEWKEIPEYLYTTLVRYQTENRCQVEEE